MLLGKLKFKFQILLLNVFKTTNVIKQKFFVQLRQDATYNRLEPLTTIGCVDMTCLCNDKVGSIRLKTD